MAHNKRVPRLETKKVKAKDAENTASAKGKGKAKDVVLPKVVQRAREDSVSSNENDSDADADGLNGGESTSGSSSGPEDSGEEEDGEDEDSGVDEEGMQNLMKLLGEDGLDEVGRAQLEALAHEESDDESGDGSGEENSSEEESAEEEGDEDEEEGRVEDVSDVRSSALEAGDEEEGEEGVALDEVESVVSDAIPRQKIEINNKIALERIRDTIKLNPSLPWTETLVVSYPEPIDVDVNDDLNRELAFYKQALHGANTARSLAQRHSLPFTRPSDYFAEMVKSDSHMQRIRQRLLDEQAGIKKSEDKRREREGKKFGKQVQMEKLKERERAKKDMEERVKGLKRKRKGALDTATADDDGFDIAVEDALSERPLKRSKGPGGSDKKHIPRNARDQKFGFGWAGRRGKQNTRSSTDDFEGNARGGKGMRGGRGGGRGGRGGGRGGSQRLGKSRRMVVKSRS